MHSWPMIVESMSATRSLLAREASGWTIRSTSGSSARVQRTALGSVAKRRSAASPSSIQVANAAPGSSSRSRPSARSTSLSSSRPAAISVAMPTNPPLALIAGPTASGKSAVALALAERTGGVIVNADSAQLYGDLKVLSAAPTAEDQKRAEHRLYGVVDGDAPCSAADWAALARAEITDIHRQQRLPILVGGTGLY